jgi:hypothetical protein
MQCCLPPIHVVPEGSFYCFYCSPKGSTAQLEEYFEEHEDSKHEFEMENTAATTTTASSFVNTLHQEDLEEEQRLQQREQEEQQLTTQHTT